MSEPASTTVAVALSNPVLASLDALMRSAVADLERVKAASQKAEPIEDAVARIFRNTNEDEVPGVTAVRDAILRIVEKERAESTDMSDDERKALRTTAREQYNTASTTFDNLVKAGMAAPEDGYSKPTLPGGGTGSTGQTLGKRDFPSPKGLVHAATLADGTEVTGTFATLAGKTKVETKTIVETLLSIVENFENVDDESEVSWEYESPKGTVQVVTTRKKD